MIQLEMCLDTGKNKCKLCDTVSIKIKMYCTVAHSAKFFCIAVDVGCMECFSNLLYSTGVRQLNLAGSIVWHVAR